MFVPCLPSSHTASPPKVLSLDEVMEAGKDLFKLKIAHEIVMNKDFHMEPNPRPSNRYSMFRYVLRSLCGRVFREMSTTLELLSTFSPDMQLVEFMINGCLSYILFNVSLKCNRKKMWMGLGNHTVI